jgi:flavin-dependent dehydrogenase
MLAAIAVSFLGAEPAGLTAAIAAAQRDLKATVFERAATRSSAVSRLAQTALIQ